jgi:hypothetical protein
MSTSSLDQASKRASDRCEYVARTALATRELTPVLRLWTRREHFYHVQDGLADVTSTPQK